MAGLEQMIFPSGDVWMAAYIKDKSEHFELRTADHNGNGFRNLWNCTQPIGRSVEDFPYQEEKILRNALSFINTAIRKYSKSTPEEKDASAHELRLRLMTRAMALCEKNALFLPAAAEIMRIAAAEPEKMSTRALKKIVDNHNVILQCWSRKSSLPRLIKIAVSSICRNSELHPIPNCDSVSFAWRR